MVDFDKIKAALGIDPTATESTAVPKLLQLSRMIGIGDKEWWFFPARSDTFKDHPTWSFIQRFEGVFDLLSVIYNQPLPINMEFARTFDFNILLTEEEFLRTVPLHARAVYSMVVVDMQKWFYPSREYRQARGEDPMPLEVEKASFFLTLCLPQATADEATLREAIRVAGEVSAKALQRRGKFTDARPVSEDELSGLRRQYDLGDANIWHRQIIGG
ncbi:hypothetical protein PSEUBRA_001890 [Kalmanozyma brasiliensis GHG001]|uniref:uncharacterized protein n=1 Tax=Kalmanozyma brasiliensis (strain GHG001) TaxID=1365824 RepID=UPI002867D08C|nr:uncharacterized protein PSEUBRA_001890 [Kalmanozyma brasiliensis GHG001]KAF6767013.1 hypothetical protein PSEUBRA_001890 [Kalmanozyma brasiliensis GHG001]